MSLCLHKGCHGLATINPLWCEKHRYFWLPCACTVDHYYDDRCYGPVHYDAFEHAKAQRLAREKGQSEGYVIPYKMCELCAQCRFMRLGTSSQLEGWPEGVTIYGVPR